MKNILTSLCLLLIIQLAYGKKQKKEPAKLSAPTITTLVDSVSYSLGVNIGRNLKQQSFDTVDYYFLGKAIMDMINETDSLLIAQEESSKIINDYISSIKKKAYEKNVKESEAFLAENSKRPEVTTLPSGLQYEILVAGNGDKPGPTDRVTVHYHGTLVNGKVFDSSVQRGQPATFGVNQVIKGWTEALQLMPVGSKWKLYIPQDLAYGANPRPGGVIEPYMALIFEVELIEIAK